MNLNDAEETFRPKLTHGLVFLMTLTCGFTVANVYLNQTLLASMAQTFGVTVAQIGLVATLAQVGYALGNLFLVPLGDMMERRRLILILLGLVSLSLAAVASSMSLIWLVVFHFTVGLTTVIPQIVVPLAASLAQAEQRGKVLGNVAIGLVCGILGARLISGWVDGLFGWRAMYWISFSCMVLLMALIRTRFPRSRSSTAMSYLGLIKSLGPLLRREQVLRQACVSQGLVFGAFSVFWTTLAFLLKSPAYSLGTETVGLVGLVGIGGAFATPVIGRLVDRKGAVFAGIACTAVALMSFVLFLFGGYSLPAVVFAAFLLTVGTQANQVACQARIFALSAEMRSRLNGLYMVSTFLGGALGSYLGVLAWSRWQWAGVCITGIAMILVSFSGLIRWRNTSGKNQTSLESN
ncbi:MFS transporter [Paenibacillus caui]|uniref:MFS transporter n=1 Tax=Paenibacillus caui TaxID=2873927 RepID=UPI001CA98A4B|nr:MFS transporter [Paenibacillus caui]